VGWKNHLELAKDLMTRAEKWAGAEHEGLKYLRRSLIDQANIQLDLMYLRYNEKRNTHVPELLSRREMLRIQKTG
jgi:hypothetical protein